MNEMIKVGVLGAAGRMGKSVCAAVEADPALTLFAAFDPNGAGAITAQGIAIQVDLDAFLAEGPDVVVDFTVAEATRQNLPRVAAAGIHAVVGTTGCTDDDMVSFEAAFTSSNLLIAANFAISAVLMMRFAEMAAPFFDTGEVIELHHDKKIDAPSGTAVATAERMAAVSTEWAPDPTEHEVYPGARGGRPSGYPRPLRAHARDGCASRSDSGRTRPEPDHSPRQLRPFVFYARRGAGMQAHRRPGGCHYWS